MSYNSSTKTITAPPSKYDVQQALNTSENDVGRLCTHQNINMWAKCKPIKAALLRPLDYAHAEQVTLYHAGLAVVCANTESEFITKVKNAFTSNDYKDKNGDCVMVKYDRPEGGMASPYRLSDFAGYRHLAELDFSIPNGEASGENHGDGLPISSVYSRNMEIDLTGTVLSDVDLPDDSARLAYYDNFLSNSINTRQNLHALDLIKWANANALALKTYKRGIMLWNDDVTYIYTERIPFGTNSELANELGSSRGKSVNVVEFYYNNTGIGQKYVCIPIFSYTTTCRTRFTFTAAAIDGNNYDYISLSISSFDGELTNFHNLWLGLEMKVPNSDVWEKVGVSTGDVSGISYDGWITIRYYGETKATSTNNPGSIIGLYEYNLDGINDGVTNTVEGVTSKAIGPAGTKVRAVLYGTLSNNTSRWEYFYRTPEENWLTL